MAVIGSIRKRVGLVIAFIGGSLVLFILGDLVTSNKGIMSRNSDVIGVIGGDKVHYAEFERKVETMTENYKANQGKDNIDQNMSDMLREQAWSMEISELTLGKEYKKLGVSCSSDELGDMVYGKNVDPQILQVPIFKNKETGQFMPQEVIKFIKDLPNRDEKMQQQWKAFEENLHDKRVEEKYNSIIKNGIYATTAEAKDNYNANGRMATVKYILLDFNSLPDTSVKVEDSDLRAYYDEHKNNYKQDQTVRKVEYVSFEVKPSAEDKVVAEEWVNKTKADFAASTNDSLFVNQNSDSPYDSTYKTKGSLSPALDSLAFSSSDGTIIGPYTERDSYKIAKVISSKMVPDSVKARHILIKIESNDTTSARKMADSLKAAIKKGQKFADLATKYSTDQGSAIKGGDLGWFRQGQMVGPFNDACFDGQKGDMPVVVTQFGVHLIEILDKGVPQKMVRVAIIERKVEPSQKTYDIEYQKAQTFAASALTAEEFDNAVIKQGLNKRIADNIRENDKNVAGLEQPREMVRWAYKSKKNEVSKVFTFGDKYVVAKLTDIREKGTLPMEAVMAPVKSGTIKAKKAQKIMDEVTSKSAGATSIDAVSQKINKQWSIVDNVSFGSNSIPGLGNEPVVLGNIFAMKTGQLSKPIKGENAVFVLYIEKFIEPAPTKDYSATQRQIMDSRKNRAEGEVFSALKEKAEIEDNRGKFY